MREHLHARLSYWLSEAKQRVHEQGPPSQDKIDDVEAQVALVDEAIRQDMPLRTGRTERESLEYYAKGFGLQIPDDPAAFDRFNAEFKFAYRDYLKAFVAHLRTFDGYDFTTAASAGRASQRSGAEPNSEAGITLGELIKRFTADRQKAQAWGPRTADEKEKHFNLLRELLGADKDLKSIAIADAQRVKSVVTRYPKNRTKNPKLRGLLLDDMINDPSIETIDVLTANKYIQTFSSLFQWGVDNLYADRNLFERMVIHNSSSGETREAFSKEQIQRIIAEVTDDNSLRVIQDYQKWGTLIGIYTGARLNEIAQLRLDDLKTDSETGIWFFDLNEDGHGKQLKNQASKRRVPVHSQLVALGLPAYVERLRTAGRQRLFPTFTKDLKNGYGRALGRWFNERLLPELRFKSSKVSFHSLRHTAITTMMQAGVEEPVVKSVVGHTKSGVTQQHYFKAGYTLHQLQSAVEEIQFT
ncbi:site-specific integrase [Ancylobacter sp. VNQ12]